MLDIYDCCFCPQGLYMLAEITPKYSCYQFTIHHKSAWQNLLILVFSLSSNEKLNSNEYLSPLKYKIQGQVPVAHSCNPSYSRSRNQEDCSSRLTWVNIWRDIISKIPNTKRASRVAQVVECLPSKHEAMSPNPNTMKKKKKDIKFISDLVRKMILGCLFSRILLHMTNQWNWL
jgi:hypothetical protein